MRRARRDVAVLLWRKSAATFVRPARSRSSETVASVALYTRREPRDIRTIAMDASSRTSVALVFVLAAREFGVASPEPIVMKPDCEAMLAKADAALLIGDNALFFDHKSAGAAKIDLGELWKASTGLPFVYAFWAGRSEALTSADIDALQRARDQGVANVDGIARRYFEHDAGRQAIAARYLRDNIHCFLGPEEMEGLRTFYRYAAEAGLVAYDGDLRLYHANTPSTR